MARPESISRSTLEVLASLFEAGEDTLSPDPTLLSRLEVGYDASSDASSQSPRPLPWSIHAAPKAGGEAEIWIYSDIDDWGYALRRFTDDLRSLKSAKSIRVRISSTGGNAFDGLMIHDLLRQHSTKNKVPITTQIDGLVASAASAIAMAGDTIEMSENGWLMIHNSWMFAMGETADLARYATLLSKVDGRLSAIYQRRTGLSESEISSMMDEETWMDSDDAIKLGFADSVIEAEPAVAAGTRFDLSSFTNVPAAVQARYGQAQGAPTMSKTARKADDEQVDDQTENTEETTTPTTPTATGAAAEAESEEATVQATVADKESILASLRKFLLGDGGGDKVGAQVSATKPGNGTKEKTVKGTKNKDDGEVEGLAVGEAIDWEAEISSRLDARLSALSEGIAEAISSSLKPISDSIAAQTKSERTSRIQSALHALVRAGRIAPAELSALEPILTMDGATDEAVNAMLTSLSRRPSLAPAAADFDPDTGQYTELSIPREFNIPAATGLRMNDFRGLRNVLDAKRVATEAGGTPEEQFDEFRRQVYAREEGSVAASTSIAFN